MIYRVSLSIGYYTRLFDFDDINAAGRFATTIMQRQVVSEDHKERQLSVTIEVLTPQAIEEEEEK